MSRFEFHPVTREPFPQEPRPAAVPQFSPRFQAAASETAANPDPSRRIDPTPTPATDPSSGFESGDASHAQERQREEQGNRGPEEEPGFGQGA